MDSFFNPGESGSDVGQGNASGAVSVSAALALAKRSLEAVTLRIVGEVSEVSVKAGYKAAYFTVKDQSASLPCMMWNNRYRASGVELRVGQLVEIAGRFTLYAAKGRMNFDVTSLSLAGEGDLRLKVANIAKRLQAEGLTAAERKRAIPVFPETIGLVTSPRSAAVHDVLRTLRRRFPVATVQLAGVPVEGAHAAEGIIEGLRCVVSAGCEVVLIVRGGGSFEDMMPFNDEALARAIAACPVPVVTGIGHEVDTSIADMVSDFRASTPTAAAEAVSPSPDLRDTLLAANADKLAAGYRRQIAALSSFVSMMADRPLFKDPMMLFAADAQMIDSATERLARALPANVDRNRQLVELGAQRMQRSMPPIMEKFRTNLETARSRMLTEGPRLTQRHQHALATSAARLEDLSPLGVIARGYSYARDEAGRIVKSVDQAPVGSRVSLTVSDGWLECDVVESQRKESANGNER